MLYESYLDNYDIDFITDSIMSEMKFFDSNIDIIEEGELFEKFKDHIKKLWTRIIDFFKGLRKMFMGFIKRIKNFFTGKEDEEKTDSEKSTDKDKSPDTTSKPTLINRSAMLIPKKLLSDLETCLKTSESRIVAGAYPVIETFINEVRTITPDKAIYHDRARTKYANWSQTIFNEIDRVKIESKESMESIDNMEEFDRLKNNKYSKEKSDEKVNFALIDRVSKQYDNECKHYEDAMEKAKNVYDNIKDDSAIRNDTKKASNSLIEMCSNVAKYYSKKVTIINYFFKDASKITKNSIEDLKKQKSGEKLDYKNKKLIIKNKGSKYNLIYLDSKDKMDKAEEIVEKLRKYGETGNLNVPEYKKYFAELRKVLGISDNFVNIIRSGIASYKYIKLNSEKIRVGSRTLYHQSSNPHLKELVPQLVVAGGVKFYPEPMIYCHSGIALDRIHGNIDTDYRFRRDMVGDKIVYKLDTPVDYVYQDTEGNSTSSIIISDKPIKVTKIDYEKYKKEKGMNTYNL